MIFINTTTDMIAYQRQTTIKMELGASIDGLNEIGRQTLFVLTNIIALE